MKLNFPNKLLRPKLPAPPRPSRSTAVELIGAALVGYGVWLIHGPSAYILGGLFVVFLAMGLDGNDDNPERNR